MNAHRVSAAAGVICAAQKTKQTPAGIAVALEAAGLLQSPEPAAELVALREAQVDPLVVSRFDTAIEPAPEEDPVLIVGAVADNGRPVALLLDLEARSKVARWLAPELESAGLASPWERAVAGLNALVDADVAFWIEPDGHISGPFGDEHIEWDQKASRWVLTHDDTTPSGGAL